MEAEVRGREHRDGSLLLLLLFLVGRRCNVVLGRDVVEDHGCLFLYGPFLLEVGAEGPSQGCPQHW